MKGTRGRKRAFVVWAGAAAVMSSIGVTPSAHAANYIGPSAGNWSDPLNWNPNGVPDGPAASANISLAPAGANFVVFHDYAYVPATGLDAVVVNSANANTVEVFSHADMHAVAATIGDSGGGLYTQAFTANATFDALFLGNAAAAHGTYQLLSSGALTVGTTEYIGYAGAGTFAQSSGTHTAGSGVTPADVYLGYQSSATGVYNLGGTGEFTVNGNESIGFDGSGTFAQTGGQHRVNGFEYIGYGGVGRYIHSGGDHFVGGPSLDFILGYQAGASGSYELGGSALLAVGGDEFIGYGGAGAFTHDDAVHDVGRAMFLGFQGGATGSYTLNSGTLTVRGGAYVGYGGGGASGTFTQNGGTYSVGTLTSATELVVGGDVGASGRYTLAGGSLLVRGSTRVGVLGAGTFTQAGGTHSVLFGGGVAPCVLELGFADTANGTYNLAPGAELNVSGESTVGVFGAGTFNQTGGTFNIGTGGGGSGILRIAQMGGSSGRYTMSSGALSVTGPVHVGGAGAGTFVQSGGTHTVGTPTLPGELRVGVSAGGSGRYDLGGGASTSLAVHGSVYVGVGGAGDFTQTDGTHSIDGMLRLGEDAGATGTYTLGGPSPTLTMTGSEHVGYGGVGSFAQSGGTHVVGASAGLHMLAVGVNAGSTGRYTLDAGSLQVFGPVVVGNAGSGTFTQTGGTSTVGTPAVGYGLLLGAEIGSTGTYELSGGELSVNGGVNIGSAGDGTFAQTGGAHGVGGTLTVGSSFGGDGLYTLGPVGANALLGVTNTRIGGGGGAAGAGMFVQSGGLHVVSSVLEIDAGGTYELSGTGELAVGGIEVMGTADGGVASFTQSGGTHTVGSPFATAALFVGNATGSSGRFTLSGGELAVHGTEAVGSGGAGTFVQSGGTHTIGSTETPGELRIAHQTESTGSYALTLAGATLTVHGNAFVGGSLGGAGGVATLSIAAGNANIDALTVYDTGPASPAGTRVNLTGGTLSLGSLNLSGNLARFNWTGGTLHFTNGVLIDTAGPLGGTLELTAGKTLSTGGGTLANNGMIALAGGTIGGAGAISNTGAITGFGTIAGTGGFTNHGSVTQSGGGNIVFANTGSPNTNFGNIDLASGRQFTLSGAGVALLNRGTINLNNATINGAGALTNSTAATIAGRGTISGAFANPSGVVAVSGGTLNVTQAFNNGGVIRLDGSGAHLGGGAVTNSGRIQGDGSVSSAIVNASGGRIEAGGGGAMLTLGGVVTNNSGATLSSGVAGSTLLLMNGLAAHTNNGAISLAGGTFDYAAASPMTNDGVVSGRGAFTTSAGLINNGQVQLSGGFSDVHGGVTGNSGSRVIVSGGATATFYDAVTLNSGSEFRVSSGATAVFFGDVTGFGAGTFTGGGTKIFEAGSASVSSIATPGVTIVQAAADVTAGHVREAALTVEGVVNMTPGGGTSRVGALDVRDDGSLDLSDNKLIVAGGEIGTFDGAAYNGLSGRIAAAYNFGAWDQPGIKTSQPAAGQSSGLTTIAIATADEVFYAGGTFGGLGVASGDVLLMYTYAGDVNLDGVVDGADYGTLDNWIQFPGTSGYANGDVNYDGVIDGADYGTLDNSIQLQGAPFPSGTYPASPLASVTAVPEPAACGFALFTASALLFHRRRRRYRGHA